MSYYLSVNAQKVIDANKLINPNNKDTTSNFNLKFRDPLVLPALENKNKRWMIAMTSLRLYNTSANISLAFENNTFSISNDGGNNWAVFTVPDGLYGVDDVLEFIQNAQISQGWVSTTNNLTGEVIYPVEMVILESSNKIRFDFNSVDFQIDLAEGFAEVLGFSTNVTLDSTNTEAERTSDQNPDFLQGVLNRHSLTCSIVDSNYGFNNDSHQSILYEYTPSGPPSSLLIYEPINPIYLQISPGDSFTKIINNIKFQIIDSLGRVVDFRGENVLIGLHIKLQEIF
jgi:hypothetical protein